jgi:uncharacterized membrane protein YcaP (DUF421 family)
MRYFCGQAGAWWLLDGTLYAIIGAVEQSISDQLLWLVGVEQEYGNLSTWQIIARTILVYLIAFVLIRLGKRRFMGDFSATDILLGFIVGSVMARAVTGAVSILNMMIVVGVLLGIHWAIVTISFYWSGFAGVVENDVRKLVDNGEVIEQALKASKITREELKQACRENGHVDDIDEVKSAYLERDGSITVIKRNS